MYKHISKADEQFRREAEEATRQNPDWSYSKEIASLKASLSELAARSRKITEVKLKASKENSKAMQFLQMQQQQLQAIQQQVAVSLHMYFLHANTLHLVTVRHSLHAQLILSEIFCAISICN